MKWLVIDLRENKELDKLANGNMAEAIAKQHKKETDHRTVVAYEPKINNSNPQK